MTLKKPTEENPKTYNIAVDPAHCIMIQAQTERAKRIISRYADSNTNTKTPELPETTPGNSQVSTDFLIKAINILNIDTDHLRIKAGKDLPIQLITNDFKIIIAPRIEEE